MNKQTIAKTGRKAARGGKVSDRDRSETALEASGKAKPAKAGKRLTQAQQSELQQLETTIGSGLTSFVEVGRALSKINASRLYRKEDGTFEDYCERRWDMSRQNGYRLIKASECFDLLKSKLPKGVLLPRNESQLRPLLDLKPRLLVDAWKLALADSLGVKITAEVVEKAVRKFDPKSKRSKLAARKKPQASVLTRTVANVAKVAERALGRPKATAAQLREVLEEIRDKLKRLVNGNAS